MKNEKETKNFQCYYFSFFLSNCFSQERNSGCESGIEDVISHDSIIDVEYEKPSWLTGHIKECAIETYISNEYQDVKSVAEESQSQSSLLPFQLVIEVSRTVVHPYESIIVDNYQYTGGAHGNTTYKYYNLKNKKNISFEEYLAEIDYSEQELLQLVNRRLKNDPKTFDGSFLKSLEDFKNKDWGHIWKIHQRDDGSMGIALIFPEYSVGPYAAGPIKYSF